MSRRHPTRPLEAWLRDRLAGADEVEVSGLRPAGAGQSNDTSLFDAQWRGPSGSGVRPLVLRRQPGAPLSPVAHVLREARVLEGLSGTAVPVPGVVGVEADPAVLGEPFVVMEAVAGRVPIARPSIHVAGWLAETSASRRRQIWTAGLSALARVHDVPWRRTHGFLGPAGPSVRGLVTHLDSWHRWATAGRPHPVTDHAVRWLHAHAAKVAPGDDVLTWGDARLGNLIVDDRGGIAAVIDWEFATIAPREYDVAYWRVFDEFLAEASGFARLPGTPTPEETVTIYEEAAAATLRDLRWFEVAAALSVAITIIRQTALRAAAGALSPESTMGRANPFTQMLARRLELPVPETSPDFSRHRGGIESS